MRKGVNGCKEFSHYINIFYVLVIVVNFGIIWFIMYWVYMNAPQFNAYVSKNYNFILLFKYIYYSVAYLFLT